MWLDIKSLAHTFFSWISYRYCCVCFSGGCCFRELWVFYSYMWLSLCLAVQRYSVPFKSSNPTLSCFDMDNLVQFFIAIWCTILKFRLKYYFISVTFTRNISKDSYFVLFCVPSSGYPIKYMLILLCLSSISNIFSPLFGYFCSILFDFLMFPLLCMASKRESEKIQN